MEVRRGYKQTEIGTIPEDWDAKEIGDVCTLVNGRGFKPFEWERVGLPIIRIQNLNGSEHFNFYAGTFDSKILIEHGQLLFAWSGSRGTSFGPHVWTGGHALLNYHTWKVVVKQLKTDAEFLLHALRQLTGFIEDRAHGASALVHTQKWEMEKFLVPLPRSAKEQRAVAVALSDVDALLERLRRLIAKKRDLMLAVMQQLLTGQSRLPGFQEEWEVKRLGDHFSVLRNGVNSRAELLADGKVKYLHYGDIHGSEGLILDPRETAMPHLSAFKAAKLDRLMDGDLVFADASEDLNGVGKSVELRGVEQAEIVPGLHTIAIRFDKSILADGFKAYLQFIPTFRLHLRRLAAGTKVYATNRSHIASVEMRLPNVEEQTAIAAVLSDMGAEISALEIRSDKTRALKQAMMQDLLTGKTRLLDVEEGTS